VLTLARFPLSNGPSVPLEAWHVVTTVDALFDSDEEDIDEPARHAYGTPTSPPLPNFPDRLVPDFMFFCLAMRLQVLADFHQSITSPTLSDQWQRASAT